MAARASGFFGFVYMSSKAGCFTGAQKIIQLQVKIDMLKTVKEIINKRIELYQEDDYGIEICRNELIEVLSKDELLTIDILNQLNDEEILYTSEVFEEIAYNLQSENYIHCLEKIYRKYPHLNIEDAIEVAKKFSDM